AEREESLVGGSKLAFAVARYYFKLLAYKDEYEVSRLYTDGEFVDQIRQQFAGEPRLAFHVTMQFLPAFLVPRDPDTGRAPKWTFPAWFMFAIWKTIRRFTFLRGTPFDPFGWTSDRRLERHLPKDYEHTLQELVDGLNAESHELAVAIAEIPELIRGYGTVKDRHLEEARAKEEELLDAFRRRSLASN
ncbi:MAG: indolepyruvate ferredoxin oxidoreductase family protein, partial [Deltaproteobacteria bacterium]|nr:indolepyruvate ferredoxin oxidoreductase family protein [Deltaproteobacteria bacterium]